MSPLVITDEEIKKKNGREVEPGDVVWVVPEGEFDPNEKDRLRLAVVTNEEPSRTPGSENVMITGVSGGGFPLVEYPRRRLSITPR